MHILRILLCSITVMAFNPISVSATERTEICAKYRASSEWSDAYSVEAAIAKGHELNQATSSFDYQGFDTYVVIFWDKDEVSVIQMESPFVTIVEQTGFDQQGREWQIKRGSICF